MSREWRRIKVEAAAVRDLEFSREVMEGVAGDRRPHPVMWEEEKERRLGLGVTVLYWENEEVVIQEINKRIIKLKPI